MSPPTRRILTLATVLLACFTLAPSKWPASKVTVTGLTASDIQAAVDSGEIASNKVYSDADCSAVATGTQDDICIETGDESVWYCSSATCNQANWTQTAGGISSPLTSDLRLANGDTGHIVTGSGTMSNTENIVWAVDVPIGPTMRCSGGTNDDQPCWKACSENPLLGCNVDGDCSGTCDIQDVSGQAWDCSVGGGTCVDAGTSDTTPPYAGQACRLVKTSGTGGLGGFFGTDNLIRYRFNDCDGVAGCDSDGSVEGQFSWCMTENMESSYINDPGNTTHDQLEYIYGYTPSKAFRDDPSGWLETQESSFLNWNTYGPRRSRGFTDGRLREDIYQHNDHTFRYKRSYSEDEWGNALNIFRTGEGSIGLGTRVGLVDPQGVLDVFQGRQLEGYAIHSERSDQYMRSGPVSGETWNIFAETNTAVANPWGACDSNVDSKRCSGGTNKWLECASDPDCPGSTCIAQVEGDRCERDVDCQLTDGVSTGLCEKDNGVCVLNASNARGVLCSPIGGASEPECSAIGTPNTCVDIQAYYTAGPGDQTVIDGTLFWTDAYDEAEQNPGFGYCSEAEGTSWCLKDADCSGTCIQTSVGRYIHEGRGLRVGIDTSDYTATSDPPSDLWNAGPRVDDAIMNAFRSIEVKTDFSGVDADIATYKGLDFLAPIAPGSGSDIVVYNTVDFADQGGVKATYSRLMHFAAQSDPGSHSTPQERHNIIHEGFNWNDGHFVAGDWELGTDGDHLWRDQTDEVWRSFTDGNGPIGESAGVAFVTGTNADTHGPMFWGDADNAAFDQGTEVCEALGVGLTCVQAMEADGTEIASCATVATGSASGFFYALCK